VEIEETGCARAGLVHHVEVDHACRNIRRPQEVLNRADIDTGFQQVRGEGMSEGVAGGPLRRPDAPNRLGNLVGKGILREDEISLASCKPSLIARLDQADVK